MSSGFQIRQDSSKPAKLLRLVIGWKFQIMKLKILSIRQSNIKDPDQTAPMCRLILFLLFLLQVSSRINSVEGIEDENQ